MGKYDGILLCSDFDGTLAIEAVVSEENARAIKYFQENGGLFTLISGRPIRTQKILLTNVLPNTYVCGCNGAEIGMLDGSETVYSDFLDRSVKESHIKICREVSGIKAFHLFSKEKCLNFFDMDFDEAKVREIVDNGVYKIVYTVDPEKSDFVKENVQRIIGNDYLATRSSILSVEVLRTRNVKGKAARRLADMVGAKTLVCAGDYENDISMVAEADIGYAVGNACDELKRVADRVTVDVSEHAIAKIIEEL